MRIIQDIIKFWAITWRESPKLFWLETIATTTSIISSIILTYGGSNPTMIVVFPLYLIGSVLFQISAYIRKNSWLFLLMSWYSLMNVIGLINVIIEYYRKIDSLV